MSTVTIDIRPEHIRAAIQSAAGLEIKFPSLAAERHIARFLSRVNWTVVETTPAESPTDDPEFIVEFPLNGRWVRSADYPERYTAAQASEILAVDLSGLKVGYRVTNVNERFIIEFLHEGVWGKSQLYRKVYTAGEAGDILFRNTNRPYRKTVYL